MPQVPIYTRTETDRPIHQRGLSVRASADDMGAAIGRGLQDLGQGVRSFAANLPQRNDDADSDDVARAKEADNALAAYTRETLYGDGGFLSLSGRAAVDAEKSVVAGIAARRDELAASLPPGAQAYFNAAAGTRINQAFDLADRHTVKNRKLWHGDTSTARTDNFRQEAVVNADDPAKVQVSLALGQAEIRQRAEAEDWDDQTLFAAEQAFISGTQKQVLLKIAASDPISATAYFEDHRHQLTGEDQVELSGLLDGAVKDETAKRFTQEIMGNIRNGDGDVESALAGIQDQGIAQTVRLRVSAAIAEEEQAENLQTRAAKSELFTAIDNGATPDSVPFEVRQRAGAEAVAAGWDFTARRAAGQPVESDPELLYELQREAARDPQGFLKRDLNDYFTALSKPQRAALSSLQQAAASNPEKARKDGQLMRDVFEKSEIALAEIGITPKHKYGRDRQLAQRQIAEIANSLPDAIDTFRKANNGRDPDAFEVTKLINQQLLPLVMRGRPTRVG